MAAISSASSAVSGTRKLCWNSNAAAKRWPAVLKKPTRCCAKPDTRQREERLRNIFLDIRVLHLSQFVGAAFKHRFAFAQDHEAGADIETGLAVRRLHVFAGRIIVVAGESKAILQAMGHHERAGCKDVALLHDQFDNRGGSDGIQAP